MLGDLESRGMKMGGIVIVRLAYLLLLVVLAAAVYCCILRCHRVRFDGVCFILQLHGNCEQTVHQVYMYVSSGEHYTQIFTKKAPWLLLKARSCRRAFFQAFPKLGKTYQVYIYISRFTGVQSLHVKFSRSKKIRKVKFRTFGEKKQEKIGRLKNWAKKI